MGQARRRKLAGTYPAERKLEFRGVGFGGLCGSCDEIHEPIPNPFIYTIGLTDEDRPELLLVAPSRQDVEHLCDLLTTLAELQRRRGKAFSDGEHVHSHQIGMSNCVQLVAVDRHSEDFPLGGAMQRYGSNGYRVMRVLPLERV